MKENSCLDAVEVKKANLLHHDLEAEFFEVAHPEGSSLYEKSQVLKAINLIRDNLTTHELCVDVGCGTGFVTGFELFRFKDVVAIDISRRMLEVAKRRFGNFDSLSLVVCDVEYLPLRSGVADLVSVSSVLHHLPRPFLSILEMVRLLKRGGFLYITREPNYRRLRRFFAFFDQEIVHRFMRCLPIFRNQDYKPNIVCEGLDYSKVDVHYLSGFHLGELVEFVLLRRFEVITAYSYHWIYPNAGGGFVQKLLSRSNFIIERIPFSKKLGRYLCLVARKLN